MSPVADSPTWIVLADAGGARILAGSRQAEALTEVVRLVSPEGRGSAARRSQFQDRLPRTQESHDSSRHAIEPHTRLQDLHADRLAADISRRLAEGLAAGAFGRLILVAPPRFAGRLNAALDDAVDQCVVAHLRKDLRHESLPELQQRLAHLL